MVQSVYRQLTLLLKQAGCRLHRYGKGSHEIWITPDGKTFPIPSNIKGTILANQILKDVGLPKAF